jgi:hypothetical protein
MALAPIPEPIPIEHNKRQQHPSSTRMGDPFAPLGLRSRTEPVRRERGAGGWEGHGARTMIACCATATASEQHVLRNW